MQQAIVLSLDQIGPAAGGKQQLSSQSGGLVPFQCGNGGSQNRKDDRGVLLAARSTQPIAAALCAHAQYPTEHIGPAL